MTLQRKVKLVKLIVNKVYAYKAALNETAVIQETLMTSDAKALEYEKLYTVSKRAEDLRNQRILESEADDSKKQLSIVFTKWR
jgi:hypothetical protein